MSHQGRQYYILACLYYVSCQVEHALSVFAQIHGAQRHGGNLAWVLYFWTKTSICTFIPSFKWNDHILKLNNWCYSRAGFVMFHNHSCQTVFPRPPHVLMFCLHYPYVFMFFLNCHIHVFFHSLKLPHLRTGLLFRYDYSQHVLRLIAGLFLD